MKSLTGIPLKSIMDNTGGATYADVDVLTSDNAIEVEEINHAKFISGANLCINLTKPQRVFSILQSAPGARGEDTFFKHLSARTESFTRAMLCLP